MENVKTNFIVISVKKYLISIISVIFVIFLVLYSENNLKAAKEGLFLWWNSVVPSLFPFFIATEILCSTNIIYIIGRLLNKPIKRLFNVPGEGAIAFIMGIISGYPTGAKIVCNLNENNICTKEESERLLAFTNNSGPLFILGTVGISLFGSKRIGYILLISHIISCILVGIVFSNWKKNIFHSNIFSNNKEMNKQLGLNDFGDILTNSIKKSINTILNIGGFIIFFSVILSILNSSGFFRIITNICGICNFPGEIGISLISGIIELTNGVKNISLIGSSNFILSIVSFMLGFGGFSVLLQVYSIISKNNLSIKSYFYGKLLQGIFSFIITNILLLSL